MTKYLLLLLVMMLSEHCIKSHGLNNVSEMKRVFNYCFSRFKRISENEFLFGKMGLDFFQQELC